MSKYPFTSDQRNPHVKANSAADFISHAHFLPRQKHFFLCRKREGGYLGALQLAVTLAHWPFGRLANHLSVADSDDDPNDDGACILFTFAGQKSERASPKGKPFRRFFG